MNSDRLRAFKPMLKTFKALTLAHCRAVPITIAVFAILLVSLPANASQVVLSLEFFEVGTNTVLTQPIGIGDMFDMSLSIEDAMDFGVAAYAVNFTYDNSLLSLGPVTVFDSSDVPPGAVDSVAPADLTDDPTILLEGFDVFNTTPVGQNAGPFQIARAKFTATAVGNAVFTTSSGVNVGIDPVSVYLDNTGMNLGTVPVADVTFGSGTVAIVPEPSSIVILLIGCLGFVARRR